jgi:uncharacterized protein (TIGR02757 family)
LITKLMTAKLKTRQQAIRDVLEKLYRKYNRRNLIKPDPLQFVYNYSSRSDMEIAGLLSAVLAYGRVGQIQNSLIKLFSIIGESPRTFVLNFNPAHRRRLSGFKHRFTSGDDISDLLVLLKKILEQSGSVETYFLSGYNRADKNIIPALSNFSESLLNMYAARRSGNISSGLKYLLTSPSGGSACKRLNLFLRWMVRDDAVDAGLWKLVDKAKLVVPVDIHMGRLCRILGFHDNNTVSMKTALKITAEFAEIEPTDPVKYDFSLSRVGIVENCTGQYSPACEICELFSFCLK